MGNRGLKELTCTSHGREQRGECWRVGGQGGGNRGGKIGKTVIA